MLIYGSTGSVFANTWYISICLRSISTCLMSISFYICMYIVRIYKSIVLICLPMVQRPYLHAHGRYLPDYIQLYWLICFIYTCLWSMPTDIQSISTHLRFISISIGLLLPVYSPFLPVYGIYGIYHCMVDI